MMKQITAILMGTLLMTLFCSFIGLFLSDTRSPGTKMGHKIAAKIGKEFKAKYGLKFNGISEEGPDKYITIGFELSYHKVLTKEVGRKLLLDCAHDALKEFNSYPQFTPHMANVPFTVRNILINIFIHPPKIHDVFYPDIAVFSFFHGKLGYYTHIPQNLFGYYTEEEETYEEAIKIVETQRSSHTPPQSGYVKAKS